jgi:3-hydroxyisobutyrate dehydrogenase-like beta-hydroxyacid dehydrogenase
MGYPVVCNLVTPGYEVLRFDINEKALKPFEYLGGVIVGSIVDIIENSDIVLTSLPNS